MAKSTVEILDENALMKYVFAGVPLKILKPTLEDIIYYGLATEVTHREMLEHLQTKKETQINAVGIGFAGSMMLRLREPKGITLNPGGETLIRLGYALKFGQPQLVVDIVGVMLERLEKGKVTYGQ